jgi:hypothetical protein
MSNEESKLRTELKRIQNINPDENLRYLVNQIELDNIKVSEKERVLNILNEINLGIVSLIDKNMKLRVEKAKISKQIK